MIGGSRTDKKYGRQVGRK